MIRPDLAWEALSDHLMEGARRMWVEMITSIPEAERAEFVSRLEAGELAMCGEWSRAVEASVDMLDLSITTDMLALPTYAFGSDGEGGDIAVFLVVHSLEGEEDPHAYIGIGWLDEVWVPTRPALRVIEGGAAQAESIDSEQKGDPEEAP